MVPFLEPGASSSYSTAGQRTLAGARDGARLPKPDSTLTKKDDIVTADTTKKTRNEPRTRSLAPACLSCPVCLPVLSSFSPAAALPLVAIVIAAVVAAAVHRYMYGVQSWTLCPSVDRFCNARPSLDPILATCSAMLPNDAYASDDDEEGNESKIGWIPRAVH
ncbi:hypothetical protein Dda_7475 [Drechslerella dactyloides]|uniref:Uncharacterized protein n=1 Tax=Drechslerella dactyloides TaxID=74499 RepID=A0AAD6ISM7_DREDA|nr:hypothetical protein Dda_7475 [Drechslerella dactyloides]